jgi:hypothetical protein
VDNFQRVIDRNRCDSVCDHHRCQLWRDHLAGVDHAAAWTASRSVTTGPPLPRAARRHVMRWDVAGVSSEQEPDSERLPWACMGVI